MTRAAIRRAQFAFATVAVVSAMAGSPASAESREQSRTPYMGLKGAAITSSAISGFGGQPNTSKGSATSDAGTKQFTRLIVKKLDGVRRAR